MIHIFKNELFYDKVYLSSIFEDMLGEFLLKE